MSKMRMVAGNVSSVEYDLLKELANKQGISMHRLVSSTISGLVTSGQATQRPSDRLLGTDLKNSTLSHEKTMSHNGHFATQESTTPVSRDMSELDKRRSKLGLS